MHALIGHRFGGLQARNGRAEHRLVDPVLGKVLSFGTELQAENWLLRCVDPQVKTVTVLEKPLTALLSGRICKVRFHLLLQMRAGGHVADLVAKTPVTGQRRGLAAAVAGAHGYQACIRDRAVLRSDPVLMRNLQTIRQRMVLWADLPAQLDAAMVIEQLAREPMTRGELHELLLQRQPGLHIEQLDCLLFAALLRQQVHFDLGKRYADTTQLRVC